MHVLYNSYLLHVFQNNVLYASHSTLGHFNTIIVSCYVRQEWPVCRDYDVKVKFATKCYPHFLILELEKVAVANLLYRFVFCLSNLLILNRGAVLATCYFESVETSQFTENIFRSNSSNIMSCELWFL